MGKKIVTAVPGQGIPAVVDPNPGRAASDIAEANALAEQKQEVTNAAAEQNQNFDDRVQANAQAQIDQNTAENAAADTAADTNVSDMELIHDLMGQLGVDTLYENSNQEYFTNLNLAINSEGGKKSRIRTHTLEA